MIVWILLRAVKGSWPGGLWMEDVILSCNSGCLLARTPAPTYICMYLMSAAVAQHKHRVRRSSTVCCERDVHGSRLAAVSQTVAVKVVFSGLPLSNGLLSLTFIHLFSFLFTRSAISPLLSPHPADLTPPTRPSPALHLSSPRLSPPASSPPRPSFPRSWRTAGWRAACRRCSSWWR